MKIIGVNYNTNPDWILDETDDYLVYDRSDSPDFTRNLDPAKVIRTVNIGQVDWDKLSYLIDNYDNLPEVFLWIKTNLFKSISEPEFNLIKGNKFFTPLLTQFHEVYTDEVGWVNYYKDGMYHERNNSWYFGAYPSKYVNNFGEWAHEFGLESPSYLPFAPGGNYILTRETVHKYPRDYYAKMRDMLPYAREPVEAQCAERSYYLMWR